MRGARASRVRREADRRHGRRRPSACATRARDAGVALMVGHAFRRLGAARRVGELVATGALGAGRARRGELLAPGQLCRRQAWRAHRDRNPGGPLMQLGIHHVDTLASWLGPVARASGRFAHVATEADIDDVGVVTLEFASRRARRRDGQLRVAEDVRDPPAGHRRGARLPRRLLGLARRRAPRRGDDADVDGEPVAFEERDMLAEELAEFARCVRTGAAPETGADEGIAALRAIRGALEAEPGVAAGVALTRQRYVGQALARREDERILRGRGPLSRRHRARAAGARRVRAQPARPRAGRGRPRAAGAAPGVLAVSRAADLDGPRPALPEAATPGMEVVRRPAPDPRPTARSATSASPSRCVVAESRALAEDVAELVEVDYEPLDAVVDPRASRRARCCAGRTVGRRRRRRLRERRARRPRPLRHAARGRARRWRRAGRSCADDAESGVLTRVVLGAGHAPPARPARARPRPPATRRSASSSPTSAARSGRRATPPPRSSRPRSRRCDLGRPVKWAEDRLENFQAAYQGRGDARPTSSWRSTPTAASSRVRARILADLGAYLLPVDAPSRRTPPRC